MSTYLSNSPTFLPTIQPLQPDLQLYAGTLEMKQTKFDAAAKQISNLYGSLLNSPLTRDQNVKTRDEFFKTIDYEIKKVANLDLSLQENVNQATQLFTGLYDDKNIVKDMMWTKNLRNQMERGDNFRNCFDSDKCGGEFWQGGLDVLSYRAQEFKNLSDEDAMNFADVRYVPYINIEKEARKIINEKGFEPLTQEQILGNGYILSTTNGPDVAGGPLMQLFAESFKNDPRLQDYYKASAYLERKNWVSSNAQQYGSAEAAEQVYIQEKTDAINKMFAPAKDETDFNKDVQSNNKKKLEERIRTEGTTGDDDLAKAYLATLQKENDLNATSSILDESLNAANSTKQTTKINYAAEAIDGSWGNALFNTDLQKAAVATSWIGYKQVYRADEAYFKNAAIASAERIANAKKKKEEAENDDFWSFSPEVGDPADSGEGANDIKLDSEDKSAAAQALNKNAKGATTEFKGINKTINQTLFGATKEDASSGYNQQGQSSADLVLQTDALFREYASWADRKGTAADRKNANNQLRLWESKDSKSKLGWAKNSTFDFIFDKMDESSQYNLYKKIYQPLVSGDASTFENRAYLKPKIQTLYPQLQQASNAYVVKNSWMDLKQSLFTASANKLTATKDAGPLRQFYQYTVGTGGLRNANQFALAYAFGETSAIDLNDKDVKQAMNMMPDWMKAGMQQQKNADKALVVFKNKDGKDVQVKVKDFFTEDFDVNPKYEMYSDKFRFANTPSSQLFEDKFREAKWAWRYGDKSDAWEMADDGRFVPNPYKERTTWLGRTASNYYTGGTLGEIAGWFGANPTGEYLRSEGTKQYYNASTDYNADYKNFYGRNGEKKIPQLHIDLNSELGTVRVPGGNKFMALLDMGSFSAKPISGKFSIDASNGGMDNKLNIGLWQYINASKQGGIGTGTGQSFVQAGNNMLDPKHNQVDADLLRQFIELSVAKSTKDKAKLSLLYTYSNVGGGREDMQAMTIKPLFESGAKSLLTTMVTQAMGKPADDQEVIDYIKLITTKGITMYQPDIVAEGYKPSTEKEAILGDRGGHYFYNTTKRQDLEKVMDITNQVQVPGYEDISDITIVRDGAFYVVKGKLQTGYDAQSGRKLYETIPEMRYDINTPLSQIMYNQPMFDDYGNAYSGINGVLQAQRNNLIANGIYKGSDVTHDPSYVPQLWMQKFAIQKQQPEPKDYSRNTKSQLSPSAGGFVPVMGVNYQ
jgi:hypothetical protein